MPGLNRLPTPERAVDVLEVADRVAVVQRDEREREVVARAVVQREVRAHAPRILQPQPDLPLAGALDALAEILRTRPVLSLSRAMPRTSLTRPVRIA